MKENVVYKPYSSYEEKFNQPSSPITETVTDLKLEFSKQLTRIDIPAVAKAATMSFSVELTTFKIKRIYFILVESPNAAGSCDLTNVTITCNGSYLLYAGGFSSSTSSIPDRQEHTGFLFDTIVNGTLTLLVTGTPVDTAGAMSVTIEGFQLDYNQAILN